MQTQSEKVDRTCSTLFKDKEDCCGCAACVAVCPVRALTMIIDKEGFFYPTICMDKCIKCHQCVRVCPLKND